MATFQAPKGTRDVLPPESSRWVALVARFASRVARAGYGLVVSPMFEDVGVFQRIGEATDVVRKEMYEFTDRGGRRVALRPEGTASIVRAFVQHRPPTPFKAWYVSPMFRYEQAQAGRYRQHHQVGAEVLGSDDPDVDVEVIALLGGFLTDVGLRRVTLRLNSLGDAACRPAYRERLGAYLEARRGELCEEHRDRIGANPLRVLDCKRDACRAVGAEAPRMLDELCPACEAHFARVRAGLDACGIAHVIDTSLVRGLDYYTRTTFEFAAEALSAAQNAVGGGGRYDGLAADLGGPPTPGVGFGAGIERILLACDAEGALGPAEVGGGVDVFVVDTTGGSHARDLTHALREAGVAADRAFDARSMKAQFRLADRSGARLALVVGPEEAAAGTVAVKDLRGGGDQEVLSRTEVVERVRRLLAG
jgi:histidyl-tRNA synthetase